MFVLYITPHNTRGMSGDCTAVLERSDGVSMKMLQKLGSRSRGLRLNIQPRQLLCFDLNSRQTLPSLHTQLGMADTSLNIFPYFLPIIPRNSLFFHFLIYYYSGKKHLHAQNFVKFKSSKFFVVRKVNFVLIRNQYSLLQV